MRIKRLEVSGFKSFLDKASFNFTVPITAVVGPNGCGKSNIVDAIKWVTGELSFKELRGRSMEDLIFAGSELRAPTGMAEVHLTLDNSEGRAPTEFNQYTEISVVRRVFRDGTSEFFINKTPCRLHDIIDLFLDTGIGRSSYSIIEQGRVGQIVSSKAEDRRLIIEEAAGITKYKNRKQAAQRKMEYTRQNLLRVNDVLTELKRQIGSLERAARKAERFKDFREQARTIDIALSSRTYLAHQNQLTDLHSKEVELNDRLGSQETELQVAESRIEQQRLEILDQSNVLKESQEKLFAKSNEIQNLDREIETLAVEAKRLFETAAAELERSNQLAEETAEALRRINELEMSLETLANERTEIDRELEVAKVDNEAFEKEEKTIEASAESEKEQLLEGVALGASLRNDLATLHERMADVDRQLQTRERESLAVQSELESLERSSREYQQALGVVTQLRFSFERELAQTKNRFETLGLERTEQENVRLNLSGELEGNRARLRTMEEFERTYQGYQDGVRAVMERRSSENGPAWVKGVLGELIQPTRGYERAVEAALSERIECLVVEDPREALHAVSFLKNGEHGRGAFLPRALRQRSAKLDVPKKEGILGALIEFVTLDDSIRESTQALLAGILVADSLPRAVALWEDGIDQTLVTADGDLVTREGIVVGGSWGSKRGVLEIRREIEELRETISQGEKRLAGVETRFTQIANELSAAENEIFRVDQALDEESTKVSNHEKDFERTAEAIRRCRQNLEVIEQESKRLKEDRVLFEASLVKATTELEKAEAEHQERERRLNSYTSRISEMRERMKQQSEQLLSLQVRRTTATERWEAQRREVEGLKERSERSSGEAGRLKESSTVNQDTAELRTEERVAAVEKRQIALTEHDDHRRHNDELRRDYETSQANVTEAEQHLKTMREALVHGGTEKSALAVTLSEERMRLEHLIAQVQERYALDLTQWVAQESFNLMPANEVEEAQSRLNTLREKMAGIGDVNLAAIDELAQLKERDTFLGTQKLDLEQTLDSLDSAIRKINSTTKERFVETFEAVNVKFQEIFPRLFRGGKAKLLLTDPENLLETGVEIVAQPPGKRLQNMNLLSGGEKALTAISLLFAIFQHKAPPFCLLDEVDAPLDDANVHRFLNLVREMSTDTQFILITHNKASMETADNLYGVTMEEPGVSRTVSVRIGQKGAAQEIRSDAALSVA